MKKHRTALCVGLYFLVPALFFGTTSLSFAAELRAPAEPPDHLTIDQVRSKLEEVIRAGQVGPSPKAKFTSMEYEWPDLEAAFFDEFRNKVKNLDPTEKETLLNALQEELLQAIKNGDQLKREYYQTLISFSQ